MEKKYELIISNFISNLLKNEKKRNFLLLFLLLMIVVVFIFYYVFQSISKVRISEIINTQIDLDKKENYLELSFIFPDFTRDVDYYNFGFYVENFFEEDLEINMISRMELLSSKTKVSLFEHVASDRLPRNGKRRYDVKFENIFDDSKISGINICENERSLLFTCDHECCKEDYVRNKICWEDCKLYDLSSTSKERNIYCSSNGIQITTTIEYSTRIEGSIEIPLGTMEERIKWNIERSPISVYVRPSPLPLSTLLPLDLAFEIKGDNVFIKKIKVEMINYSVEAESFFLKKREVVKQQEPCEILLNRFVDGTIYLSGDLGCRFQPLEIYVETISGNKNRLEKFVNNEQIENFLKTICKNYITSENLNYEKCAEELNRRGLKNICQLYSDLEVCKIGNLINRIILSITVEFSRREEFKKTINPMFC